MSESFTASVEKLIHKAPAVWLLAACTDLRAIPATVAAEWVLQRLPATHNADLSLLAEQVIRQAASLMSWEALSWTLQISHSMQQRQAAQHIELLWSGPSPADQISARRIDQVLYDLVANAQHDILLVTFAAAKIARLAEVLQVAAARGVRIRLILEFVHTSEGQLSHDALQAFPSALAHVAQIFYWPVAQRERNRAGKPGKLHAKLAIIDQCTLVSSANLTDDAFSRNLEVGVMLHDPLFQANLLNHLQALIADGILCPLPG